MINMCHCSLASTEACARCQQMRSDLDTRCFKMEPIITTTDSMPVTTIIETYKNGILIERKTEMRNAYV